MGRNLVSHCSNFKKENFAITAAPIFDGTTRESREAMMDLLVLTTTWTASIAVRDLMSPPFLTAISFVPSLPPHRHAVPGRGGRGLAGARGVNPPLEIHVYSVLYEKQPETYDPLR